MNDLNYWSTKLMDFVVNNGPRLLLAILTLIIGLWVIKMIVRIMNKSMERGDIDVSLRRFLSSLVSILLKVMLVISVASMVGIQMTSFIAVLGAAGLAIGLALQGSLANFAGGVLILLFRPFKAGDVIEAQGFLGKVSEIQVFNTVLNTFDNKKIIIPNAALSSDSITNFSAESLRRVDMTFGIGYEDDMKKTRELLLSLARSDQRVLKDPEPFVAVSELADSSVNFAVRLWCKNEDYWGIYFDMLEKVKLEFDKAGISIPFPQQDVHLYKHD